MIRHRALKLYYLKLSPSNTKADTMSHCFLREKWGRAELWGPGKDASGKPGVTEGCSAELGRDNWYSGWEVSRVFQQDSYRDSGPIAMVYMLDPLTERHSVLSSAKFVLETHTVELQKCHQNISILFKAPFYF